MRNGSIPRNHQTKLLHLLTSAFQTHPWDVLFKGGVIRWKLGSVNDLFSPVINGVFLGVKSPTDIRSPLILTEPTGHSSIIRLKSSLSNDNMSGQFIINP